MFAKQLYRYLVLWPWAILRRINIRHYHQQFAILVVMYAVFSGVSAVDRYPNGEWQMPFVFFNLALLVFVLGSLEMMLVLAKVYRSMQSKYQALSRAISCYGVAFVLSFVCDFYHLSVIG